MTSLACMQSIVFGSRYQLWHKGTITVAGIKVYKKNNWANKYLGVTNEQAARLEQKRNTSDQSGPYLGRVTEITDHPVQSASAKPKKPLNPCNCEVSIIFDGNDNNNNNYNYYNNNKNNNNNNNDNNNDNNNNDNNNNNNDNNNNDNNNDDNNSNDNDNNDNGNTVYNNNNDDNTGELGYDRLNGTRKIGPSYAKKLYTYDEYLICIRLGPSISSIIGKNLSHSGPSYPGSPVIMKVIMIISVSIISIMKKRSLFKEGVTPSNCKDLPLGPLVLFLDGP